MFCLPNLDIFDTYLRRDHFIESFTIMQAPGYSWKSLTMNSNMSKKQTVYTKKPPFCHVNAVKGIPIWMSTNKKAVFWHLDYLLPTERMIKKGFQTWLFFNSSTILPSQSLNCSAWNRPEKRIFFRTNVVPNWQMKED